VTQAQDQAGRAVMEAPGHHLPMRPGPAGRKVGRGEGALATGPKPIGGASGSARFSGRREGAELHNAVILNVDDYPVPIQNQKLWR